MGKNMVSSTKKINYIIFRNFSEIFIFPVLRKFFSVGMFFPQLRPSYGSTDMGNVSTVIPSIHPAFAIPGMQIIHTKEFEALANQPAAHKCAQRAAVAMAMTALELFASPEFRTSVREEFDQSLGDFVGSKRVSYGGFDFSR